MKRTFQPSRLVRKRRHGFRTPHGLLLAVARSCVRVAPVAASRCPPERDPHRVNPEARGLSPRQFGAARAHAGFRALGT